MFCRPGWPAVAHRDPSASVSSAEIKGINHHAERCLKPPSHTVLSSFYMVSQTLRDRETFSFLTISLLARTGVGGGAVDYQGRFHP